MARSGDYRHRLLEELKLLSDDRVKAVAGFVACPREREETAEILGDKTLSRQIGKSRKAWAEGKKEQFSYIGAEHNGFEENR